MANDRIGVESARVIRPNQFPPAAAAIVAQRLLIRHSAHEIAEAVEVLVDLLDLLGGDPEAEAATWPQDELAREEPSLPDDYELTGDERDCAWIEWTTMRGSQKRGANILAGHEDDEEDDAPEDDDPAGDDADLEDEETAEESWQPVTLNANAAAND